MVRGQYAPAHRQRFPEERIPFSGTTVEQQHTEVLELPGELGVFGTEHALMHFDGPAVELFGLAGLVVEHVDVGEAAQYECEVFALTQLTRPKVERLAENGLGFVVLMHLPVEDAEPGQVLSHLGMIAAERGASQLERLLVYPERFIVATEIVIHARDGVEHSGAQLRLVLQPAIELGDTAVEELARRNGVAARVPAIGRFEEVDEEAG